MVNSKKWKSHLQKKKNTIILKKIFFFKATVIESLIKSPQQHMDLLKIYLKEAENLPSMSI